MIRVRAMRRAMAGIRAPILGALTGAGKSILVAIVVCLFSFWGYPFAWFLSVLAALLVVALIANQLGQPRLEVTVSCNSTTSCGEVVSMRLFLENKSRFSLQDSSIQILKVPSSWIPLSNSWELGIVSAKSSRSISIEFQVLQRGVYHWPIVCLESTFPFGIWAKRQRIQFDELLYVAPKKNSSTASERYKKLLLLLGPMSSNRASLGIDYIGSREYIPGSTPGRWDFASWARLGRPIVRESSAEENTEVTIFVDIFQPLDSMAAYVNTKETVSRDKCLPFLKRWGLATGRTAAEGVRFLSPSRSRNLEFESLLEKAFGVGDQLSKLGHRVQFLFPSLESPCQWKALRGDRALRQFAVCQVIERSAATFSESERYRPQTSKQEAILLVFTNSDQRGRDLVRALFAVRSIYFI